ncbi:MAG TPA: LCP family protein [Oscillospiraceae bacterium]|nr:LCP family protein [Oscillospiraceae bacterium]HPF54927.1 LCP family protein [Clostridiales bacterium]HPK34986.1 LCP family protein [Oscillospiraceae bacterium]HPR75544.1 LCP family protein [Oscillospiraceae bacterium]
MKRIHISRKATQIIVAFVLICVMMIFAVQKLAAWEQKQVVVDQNTSGFYSDIYPAVSQIVNGEQTYIENKELITILFLGIDTSGEVISSGSYNNKQQADFLALLIIDPAANDCTLLHLNRDTMTDINVLGVTGQAAGTTYGQLALAHTYGTGLQDSCQNTVQTVSNLLFGISIDYFVSINMDAVALLNDLIGGVTVTISDDFSNVDPQLKEGETVTLTGQHALNYVRARQGMTDATNLARMARQRQYISSFLKQLKAKMNSENDDFIMEIYQSVSDYIVTNCTVQTFSEIADHLLCTDDIQIKTPAGISEKGDQYIEFYPDKDLLFQFTMSIFFKKTAS